MSTHLQNNLSILETDPWNCKKNKNGKSSPAKAGLVLLLFLKQSSNSRCLVSFPLPRIVLLRVRVPPYCFWELGYCKEPNESRILP